MGLAIKTTNVFVTHKFIKLLYISILFDLKSVVVKRKHYPECSSFPPKEQKIHVLFA